MQTIIASLHGSRKQILLAWVAVIIVWLVLIWVIYQFFPFGIAGVDWRDTFQPATLKLYSGQSPYSLPSFVNPAWILLPLLPLAILPVRLGYAVWAATSLLLFAIVGLKLGAKPITLFFLIFSYPVIFCIMYGQIDALVILGFILPPPVGIFLVLAKPQIGIGIAIYWIVEAWREGKFRKVIILLLPVSLAYALSFLIYGLWLPSMLHSIPLIQNASIWPMGIPIGLALLVYSLRNRKAGPSITAGPFLSPYLGPHSWAIALLGLLPNQFEMISASVGLWIIVAIKGFWI